jgi:hypothetical protein
MVETASTIWRDELSPGVPHKPIKAQIREWGTDIESRLATVNSSVIFVDNRASLKSVDTSKHQTVFVNNEGGRNGLFDFDAGNFTTLHALDTLEGVYIKATDTASASGSWVRQCDWLSPKHFGAVGDNVTDDAAALNAWHAVLMATAYLGFIDGKFISASAIDWNFEGRRTGGLVIEGESPNDSYISVTATGASPAMRWHCNSQALFYASFNNFGIRTNRAGVGFQIGQDDFADAWNQCELDGIVVNNGSANAANVSLRLNHILGTYFRMIVNAGGSGRPAQPGAPGYGTAVEMRQVIGGRGQIDAGNAVIAHRYRDGSSYGNIWTGTNIEEVTKAIQVSVGATAQNNTYLGGYIVSSETIDSAAGNNNRLVRPNLIFYGGGTIGSNLAGWSLDYASGSVTTWQNPTGISVSTAGSPVTPAGHMHLYGASGTTRARWQLLADACDIDYNGDLNIVNYKSGGSIFQNAASATGTISQRINSVEKLLINSTGVTVIDSLLVDGTLAGIGYAAAVRGTVTQLTNKATGVTLNRNVGDITMSNASLAANTTVSFVLSNSDAGANDTVIVNHISGGTIGVYLITPVAGAGQVTFYVRNTTAGALAEAIVFRYTVIKG